MVHLRLAAFRLNLADCGWSGLDLEGKKAAVRKVNGVTRARATRYGGC
jgi:hypothetical protein